MTRQFVDRAVRLNTVECLEGAVWITQSNDPRDIVLKSGQSFVLDKPGLALVCAAAGPATVAVAVSLKLLPSAQPRLPDSSHIQPAA